DFAVFPVNTAVKLYNAGPGYRLGGVTGLGTFSILSRDRAVTSWESLVGTTVFSTGKGATPDYLLTYFAEQRGLNITSDFSHNNAAQLAQLALAGKVDTVLLPEPFVSMVLSGSPEMRVVIDFQEEWNRLEGASTAYPVTVVTVNPRLAEERPETVKAFLRACRESVAWVKENPGEAGVLIEKYGILKASAAAAAIPKSNLVFIPAAEAKESLEPFLEVLLSYDPASLGGVLPDEGFYFED
ncbi:MAG: ABC transporter substrate-binding protein, partial [Spirochaetales bacterium]|nr:ABC transporter substrate-binding protein [Spirochaetales bacterium]